MYRNKILTNMHNHKWLSMNSLEYSCPDSFPKKIEDHFWNIPLSHSKMFIIQSQNKIVLLFPLSLSQSYDSSRETYIEKLNFQNVFFLNNIEISQNCPTSIFWLQKISKLYLKKVFSHILSHCLQVDFFTRRKLILFFWIESCKSNFYMSILSQIRSPAWERWPRICVSIFKISFNKSSFQE